MGTFVGWNTFGTIFYPDVTLGSATYTIGPQHFRSMTVVNPAVAYDYVWFDGHPVAQINEADNTVQYVFTDHLGTPILETSSSHGVVWRAEYEPYGTVYALRSPDTHQPLRLPGQEAEQLNLGADGVTERSYNIFRWYQSDWGRYAEGDPEGLYLISTVPNLYMYVENNPINWIDRFGLYKLQVGGPYPPLPPSPRIDALLRCIEAKTNLPLLVTSTSEDTPVHPPGSPHRRGVAVDIRYHPGTVDKILCAAESCGAGFGLNEATHPSPHSTGRHVHLQIPLGKRGGHGDLPKGECGCKP